MQYTDYDRRMTEVGHSQHQKTETLESSGTLRILKEHLDANQHKTKKTKKTITFHKTTKECIMSSTTQPKKKGRPLRTEPYVIPEMPRQSKKVTTERIQSIKHQRATELNKAASQRWRQRNSKQKQQMQTELENLETENRKLKMKEQTTTQTIVQIKKQFLKRTNLECQACKQALFPETSLAIPTVIIKPEAMEEIDIKPEKFQ